MKILFIGDVVGRPGRGAVAKLLPVLVEKHKIDFTIVNGENSAGGKGITAPIVDGFWKLGVDVISTGNHVWKQREIFSFIDREPHLIRPANYPGDPPGKGWTTRSAHNGVKVCVINLMGQLFMENVDNPFHAIDEILGKISDQPPLIILDFHGEATSEKKAMGWYTDGRLSAVLGTHTHVQTADEEILPEGTAYITDVGMTGAHDSVIGVDKEQAINRFKTLLPVRYKVAVDDVMLCGVLLEVDEENGKAISIERIQSRL